MTTQHRNEPIVRVVNVRKRFGDVHAVRDVSLEVGSGQVHVLLGENGAGKSTLISMLTGMQQPDSGTIVIDGTPTRLATPRAALDAGIVAVLQRSNLVAELSILENVRLAGLTSSGQQELTMQTFTRLHGTPVSFDTTVASLDLGVRHLIEIARAVARQPRVLILDEPTALMSSVSAERLLDLLRELTAKGVGVLFVTHKLAEAQAIANEITVLRGGEVVLRAAEPSEQDLLLALFGSAPEKRDQLGRHGQRGARTPVTYSDDHSPVLKLDAVSTAARDDRDGLTEVTFEVHQGRILGVAGISGNGQTALAQVIEGSSSVVSGSVLLNGEDVTRLSIQDRMNRGLRSVTDDRFGEGLVATLSVGLNLLLTRLGEHPFWRFGLTKQRVISEHASEVMKSANIIAESPETPVANLSGGNAQKLLLARAVAEHPAALNHAAATVTVFHQPTHGLDAKTVAEVLNAIRDQAFTGAAVLIISSDLDEIVAVSDEVLVLERGTVIATVEGHTEHTRDQIAQAMSGVQA